MRAPRSWAWSRCQGRSTRIAPASAPSTTSRLALAPCCTRRATSTRSDTLAAVGELEPELVFVVGWSQLVRDPFIELASDGVFGMHPTLLPRHRGRAPIPVGDPHRACTHRRHPVRDRRRHGGFGGHRGTARGRDLTRRDGDDALRSHRRCSRRAGQGAGAAAPGADGTPHPAGSQPCELLAEAQPRRRNHRLGDPRAVPVRLGARADAPLSRRIHVPRRREGDRLGRAPRVPR